ncbi:MAG: hypothetical protein ACR2IA_13245 [Pyrinomonadaceae bacterium]
MQCRVNAVDFRQMLGIGVVFVEIKRFYDVVKRIEFFGNRAFAVPRREKFQRLAHRFAQIFAFILSLKTLFAAIDLDGFEQIAESRF